MPRRYPSRSIKNTEHEEKGSKKHIIIIKFMFPRKMSRRLLRSTLLITVTYLTVVMAQNKEWKPVESGAKIPIDFETEVLVFWRLVFQLQKNL